MTFAGFPVNSWHESPAAEEQGTAYEGRPTVIAATPRLRRRRRAPGALVVAVALLLADFLSSRRRAAATSEGGPTSDLSTPSTGDVPTVTSTRFPGH